MRIRLLHIDECPNWADAEVRLRAALNELGLSDTPVAVELLATPEDTTARRPGSRDFRRRSRSWRR